VNFEVDQGQIFNIKVIKPIAWGFGVHGGNIKIRNHYVDAAPDNVINRSQTKAFPSNTDGFNFGGTNIDLDGYWGRNGDDCVSIVDGAQNITAKNGYCGFSSHGLSIGSLGKDGSAASVSGVVFDTWTMDNADYGARVRVCLQSTYFLC
jgi:hypothetical protein